MHQDTPDKMILKISGQKTCLGIVSVYAHVCELKAERFNFTLFCQKPYIMQRRVVIRKFVGQKTILVDIVDLKNNQTAKNVWCRSLLLRAYYNTIHAIHSPPVFCVIPSNWVPICHSFGSRLRVRLITIGVVNEIHTSWVGISWVRTSVSECHVDMSDCLGTALDLSIFSIWFNHLYHHWSTKWIWALDFVDLYFSIKK